MFFPKEHRKKMQESTFRPLLHRFCFLHLSITQKERAYWLKRNKLIGPGLILYSPDRRKRGKKDSRHSFCLGGYSCRSHS